MNRFKPYLLVFPTTIFLVSIVGTGIFFCLSQSLGYFPEIGLENITFDYYKSILSDKQFIQSLLFSIKTSLISSLVSVVIGVFLSYLMSRDKCSKFRYSILNLPIIVPHIIVVMLAFTLFSKTGIISRVFYHLGIINDSSDFINLVNDKGGIGVIIVYIYKGIPFIALTVYNILRTLDNKLENVAINLGANKFCVFRFIVLPQIMPTIISSFIIIFAFSFGSFEVPYLIGPTTPKSLPVSAYTNYISLDLSNRPLAMAINTILSIISFILLAIYNSVSRKI